MELHEVDKSVLKDVLVETLAIRILELSDLLNTAAIENKNVKIDANSAKKDLREAQETLRTTVSALRIQAMPNTNDDPLLSAWKDSAKQIADDLEKKLRTPKEEHVNG